MMLERNEGDAALRVRVHNIVWDTDGKRVKGLPSEMTVELDDCDDMDEAAVNAVSDHVGWCISDCKVEVL